MFLLVSQQQSADTTTIAFTGAFSDHPTDSRGRSQSLQHKSSLKESGTVLEALDFGKPAATLELDDSFMTQSL